MKNIFIYIFILLCIGCEPGNICYVINDLNDPIQFQVGTNEYQPQQKSSLNQHRSFFDFAVFKFQDIEIRIIR